MKLPMDTSAMAFLCAVEAEPVVDFEINRPLGNGRDRRRRVDDTPLNMERPRELSPCPGTARHL